MPVPVKKVIPAAQTINAASLAPTVSSNINEEYEEAISEYLKRGYKIATQSDNHTELKKSSVFTYLFWLLIFPNIASLVGYLLGGYHGYAPDRFTYASMENAAKMQNGFIFAGIALIISICILLASRGKHKVVIRITKTGKLDITGYTIEKAFFSERTTKIIIGVTIAFVALVIIVFIIGLVSALV